MVALINASTFRSCHILGKYIFGILRTQARHTSSPFTHPIDDRAYRE